MNNLLTHTTDGAAKHNNVAQVLTTTNGRMVAYGQMTHEEAHRLTICWNKFNGIATSAIESMPGPVSELVDEHIKTIQEIRGFEKVINEIEAAATDDDTWAAFRQHVINNTTPAASKH